MKHLLQLRQQVLRSSSRYQSVSPKWNQINEREDPSSSLHSDLIIGLTKEQSELRSTVRDFIEKELPESKASAMDKEGYYRDFRQLFRKMGDMGFLGVTASSRYNGLEMGYSEHCIVMEEISRVSGAIGLSYGAHSNLCVNQINLNGNEEQKEKYLPKLINGSYIGSLAMSETNAGSDVVSMRLTAEKKGDYYVLNGNKFWITNGSEADVLFVYAKTSERGITAFIVEKGMPGFSVGRSIDKLGMRGSPTVELIFEDCKVPVKNMVGEKDKGVYVLMKGLDYERLVLSAGPLGIMQKAAEIAFDYAHERKQFNKPIGTFQLLQGKMADMYVKLNTTRAFLYSIARAVDANKKYLTESNLNEGSIFTKDCAAAILYAGEMTTLACLDAIQILGGNGYTNEYPVGRLLRDAKLYEIGAGTSEIRRWLIGRQLNKEYLLKSPTLKH